MASCIVSGGSDDLVIVEGNITEEWGCYSDPKRILAFSNGVLLRVRYDEEGCWRVEILAGQEHTRVVSIGNPDENYTDRVEVLGAKWVVCGTEIARSKPPTS